MDDARDLPPAEVLWSASRPYPHPDLEALLARFSGRFHDVVTGCFPILRDHADDMVQQALLALISPAKLSTLRDPARLDTWAIAIVLNLCRSELRRMDRERRRRLDLPRSPASFHALLRQLYDRSPAGRSPEEIVVSREVIRAILAAVDRCPVARLAWLDGLSEVEIVARLSLRTRAQVAGRLKRLRAQIRHRLGTMSESAAQAMGSPHPCPGSSRRPLSPANAGRWQRPDGRCRERHTPPLRAVNASTT